MLDTPNSDDALLAHSPPVTMHRVLVVDDEETIREVLTDFLVLDGGYEVCCADSAEAALQILQTQTFDAALIDMKMPGMSGLALLERFVELGLDMLTIMMTGFGTVETAINAMKLGAYDYVLKPFKVQDVILLLERGLAKRQLERENIQLKQAVSVFEVSQKIATTLSLDDIYRMLIDTAREEVNADAVAIWIKQPAIGPKKGSSRQQLLHTVYEDVHRWARSDLDAQQLDAIHHTDLNAVERAHRQSRMDGSAATSGGILFELAAAHDIVQASELTSQRDLTVLAIPLMVKGKVLGFFTVYSFERDHGLHHGPRKMLSILCDRASAAVENGRLYRELQLTFKQTIQALANLLEDKDPYTKGHSDRVSKYARLIAQGLALQEHEVEEIADCALMHDIGKMGIRYEDLNKVEPLSDSEYEMFKSHTTRGKWILEPIEFLHHLIPGVYHHHERWDGRGYPLGLVGEEIPLVARVLAIADTYDAMTSHRAYRRALPHDVAIREIQAFAGAQFDPSLVEVFVDVIAKDREGFGSKAQRWDALKDYAPPTARLAY